MSATDAQRLKAGLDEDEREAYVRLGGVPCHDDGCMLGLTAEYPCDCGAGKQRLRDVAAKRAILALYEEFAAKRDPQSPHPQYAVDLAHEMLGQVVAALASVYARERSENAAPHPS